ncbi:Dual specificity phosphatase ibp1 [Smittium mucronatum]|uniref:Dual specificity phosphatase ibp1 n=1 Tax=Smittium mucronatum TaxID=133383 RepID=A0A1R0GZY1_9FUNG|nr:Dual specificity phosphatase ibp1 [Smittium mucronatum]
MNFTRITAAELGKLIKDPTKKSGTDYLVVDVRDSDYEGGHIPGALNVPSYEMRDRVDGLAKELSDVPILVFHCALSQVRGPKSARIYSEYVYNVIQSNNKSFENYAPKLREQQISVLTGGFSSWYNQFKNDPEMLEDIDHDLWS